MNIYTFKDDTEGTTFKNVGRFFILALPSAASHITCNGSQHESNLVKDEMLVFHRLVEDSFVTKRLARIFMLFALYKFFVNVPLQSPLSSTLDRNYPSLTQRSLSLAS